MYRKTEEAFYEKVCEVEGEGQANMADEIMEYVSKLDNLKEEVNHLKRAKYREAYGMQATDEVTDDMLAETTEAELFPMASQYADEDMSEDETEGTAEETSQESGALEECAPTQAYNDNE